MDDHTPTDESGYVSLPSYSSLNLLAMVLAIGGIAAMAWGAFMPVTAPYGDIINVGLQQNRLLVAIYGSAAFVAGVIVFVVDHAAAAMIALTIKLQVEDDSPTD